MAGKETSDLGRGSEKMFEDLWLDKRVDSRENAGKAPSFHFGTNERLVKPKIAH